VRGGYQNISHQFAQIPQLAPEHDWHWRQVWECANPSQIPNDLDTNRNYAFLSCTIFSAE